MANSAAQWDTLIANAVKRTRTQLRYRNTPEVRDAFRAFFGNSTKGDPGAKTSKYIVVEIGPLGHHLSARYGR